MRASEELLLCGLSFIFDPDSVRFFQFRQRVGCRSFVVPGHLQCDGPSQAAGSSVCPGNPESVAARICREIGRVTTNVMLRDLDMVLPNAADGRRLEVVADGLPLFGGAQLAVDTTLVPCVVTATPPAMLPVKMVLWRQGRQRKERTYRARGARARLVVLAVEVGGRWSEEVRSFLSQLNEGRARGENKLLHSRAEQWQ